MDNHSQAPRTIHMTSRHSRLARTKVHHPGPRTPLSAKITALYPAARVPDDPACYDANLAMDLLGTTCELPAGKHGLLIVLGEYRHALHALATQALAARQRTTG